MRLPRKRGSVSNMVRVFIPDNTSTTGAGLTGLTNASTNLAVAFSREFDAAGTAYSGANIETITTIGTYQAPSASSKVRFKAVDATNFPGLYELHFHDSATAFGSGDNSAHVLVNVLETSTSALKIGPNMVLIPLVPYDPQDVVRMGLTALPNAVAEAAGGLFTRGSGAGQINQDANGRIDANARALLGTTLTEGAAGRLKAAFTTFFDVASPVLTTASVNQTGDNFARIGNNGSALTSLAPASTALSTAVWTNGRAAFLDNLDAAISTRSTYAGADTAGTTTLLSRLTATRAGLLDNLDAAVSTRSTYAGGDTAGTTTLLSRVPGVVQPQTGDAYARLGAPVGASHSADVAAVKADTAAIKVVTDKLATTLVIVGSGPNYQYTVQALANAPAGGGGGVSVYDKAVQRGPVVTEADGSVTFLDADDGVTPRVRFGRRDYPGGRTVTLDPA
jgi:hypothetical protein